MKIKIADELKGLLTEEDVTLVARWLYGAVNVKPVEISIEPAPEVKLLDPRASQVALLTIDYGRPPATQCYCSLYKNGDNPRAGKEGNTPCLALGNLEPGADL